MLTLVAIAGWISAETQRSVADAERREAQLQARQARSGALASLSAGPLTTRPDVSLGLAFEAYRTVPRAEASSAATRALLAARRSRLRGVLTTNDYLNPLAFSPDSTTLASASDDNTVRLWDARTRKPLGLLRGHSAKISAVAFSPDSTTLASASDDSTVRLWDARTRKPLRRLDGHTGPVSAVAFSPDAKTIASASFDMTVRVWDEVLWRSVAELHATVCDILLTGLTRSEWQQYAPGVPYRRSCP